MGILKIPWKIQLEKGCTFLEIGKLTSLCASWCLCLCISWNYQESLLPQLTIRQKFPSWPFLPVFAYNFHHSEMAAPEDLMEITFPSPCTKGFSTLYWMGFGGGRERSEMNTFSCLFFSTTLSEGDSTTFVSKRREEILPREGTWFQWQLPCWIN